MYDLFGSRNKTKIIFYLTNNPNKSLKEISKQTKITYKNSFKIIQEFLEKEVIIKKENKYYIKNQFIEYMENFSNLLLKNYVNSLFLNDKGNHSEMFEGVHNKVLKAYFLKHNIQGDLMIDPLQLPHQTKGLTKLYVQMGRVLEDRNLDVNKVGIRDELDIELKRFNQSVDSFNLPNAFNCMNKYTTMSWKIVKDDTLSIDEHNSLKSLREIYFGE